MESKKPSLNFKMLKRDVLRHWPIWTVSLLIHLFFVFLVNTIVNDISRRSGEYFVVEAIMESSMYITFFMSFVMGLITSWAAFGFFGKKRKDYFYEALPFNRLNLFINRFVFGFVLSMLPCVAMFIIEMLHIPALGGGFRIGMLLEWLAAAVAEYLFWYSLGVILMVVCGRVLMAGFCYLMFSFVGLVLKSYIEISNLTCFIGYDGGLGNGKSILGVLSPLEYLFEIEVENLGKYSSEEAINHLLVEGSVEKLIVVFFAGVILALAAYFLYTKRKSENTGDNVIFKAMKYVFSWVISFVGALTLTLMLFFMLFYKKDAIAHRAGDRMVLIILMIITGFISYLVSCMIVEKRLKIFKKHWLNALIFTGVLALVSIGYLHDVFNIEGYVPETKEVQYITIDDYDAGLLVKDLVSGYPEREITMSDPEAINIIIELHKFVLNNMDKLEDSYTNNYHRDYGIERGTDYYHLSIYYKLKNNSSVSRSYLIRKNSSLDKEIRNYIDEKKPKYETGVGNFEYD